MTPSPKTLGLSSMRRESTAELIHGETETGSAMKTIFEDAILHIIKEVKS